MMSLNLQQNFFNYYKVEIFYAGVAVVIKNEIYFYRNCKPYHKYSVQPTTIKDTEECKLWQECENAFDLIKSLQILSSSVGFVNLSTTSQQMLCLNECHTEEYFEKHKKNKLVKQVSVLYKSNVGNSIFFYYSKMYITIIYSTQ